MAKRGVVRATYNETVKLDVYIHNARVITLDPEYPTATSIGIWQGKIVGVDEAVADLDAHLIVDAGGRTITPGFHDAHNHMATFGRSLANIDASPLTSLDALYVAIAQRAAAEPESEWIVADTYDQHQLGGHPTREGLDHAAPGRNVVVNHRTTHMLVASTPVFEMVGAIRPDYPVVEGGFIDRNRDGTPTGLVGEQSMAAFRNLTRPYSVAALSDALARASKHYLAEGITSVGEAGIGNSAIVGSSPIEFLPYQAAREAGLLGVRVQLMVSMENLHPVVSAPQDLIDMGLDLGIRTGLGDDRLGIGPLKMFTDGAISSRTASLTLPFCDHASTGMMQFDGPQLTGLAISASRAGWQLAVHAIGDNAVDVGLNVIRAARAANPSNTRRHRIEHASVVRTDQLERFANEDVIASIQPQFVNAIGDNVLTGLADRTDWVYRHGSFLRAGGRVAGGSDRPVVDGRPLQAIQDSVHRVTAGGLPFSPAEAVDLTTALRTYTIDAAYAIHREDRLGMLRPGYYADLVMLDGDLAATPPERIANIDVIATVVDGEFLYDPTGLSTP